MYGPSMSSTRTLLVTDLDNTLWDWLHAWHTSFSAMLAELCEATGLPEQTLVDEIRSVHRRRGTTEYSFLLDELPSLRDLAGPDLPSKVFHDAEHARNHWRRASTVLYPNVSSTLNALKAQGVTIAAYTESVAFWTEWRILHTGLDGVIDVLYSSPDHDAPDGASPASRRTLPPERYGLKRTVHRHVPKGVLKPSPAILASILEDMTRSPGETVYVGDSLMKDVAMAQDVGVLDVHARYGESHEREEYELLRRVTHWSEADVARERSISSGREVMPMRAIDDFADLLTIADGWGREH